jgi:riboflavin kinase/FMN adenylyltransferase
MEIIQGISGFKKIVKGCVLTIGNFDGLHLGHQKILLTARKAANERKTNLVLMTFEPHPVAVLHPEMAPERLLTLPLKEYLLARFGVDTLMLLKSDLQLFQYSSSDFVKKFLSNLIKPSIVVEGCDFHFGSDRSGNVEILAKIGSEKGFDVVVVEPVTASLSIGKNLTISSTIVRELLLAGNVADASIALARPYRLISKVIYGKGKGARLGFPTANLLQPAQLVPAAGVYAGTVEIANTHEQLCPMNNRIPAAVSIISSPACDTDNTLLIEAHLLIDYVPSLYGKWLAIDFIQKIRDQQKFESDDSLTSQIAEDCKKVKHILPHPNI